jgi:translation initiation factor 1 (eIF-1/SUI1)
MTWKDNYKGSNHKERNELIGQLLQEKTKVLIRKNQRREKKNTIVIVKNFNKMSIKNHNYLKITDK